MADGMAVVLVIGEGSEGIYQLQRKLMSGWHISYQGNQQRSITAPLINYHIGAVLIWRLEQSLAGAGGKYVSVIRKEG